jgi:5-methyltetrahydropteroyltriglutamate--homocysteine methyltransferase
VTLKQLATRENSIVVNEKWMANIRAIESRRTSPPIHNIAVAKKVAAITDAHAIPISPFAKRRRKQRASLGLPLFPTTTIGSFPQTTELRNLRARFKARGI